MDGFVGCALHKDSELSCSKWKKHDLRKMSLFLSHTKVFACIRGSPGKPWTLFGTWIVTGVENTFWKSGKEKEYTSPRPLAKARCLQVYHHLVVPRRGRLCKPKPPLVSSEMGFGKSGGPKYFYALYHLSLCYCFCRSVLLPKITEKGVEGRKKQGCEMRLGHPCNNQGQSLIFFFTGLYGSQSPCSKKVTIIIIKLY